MRLTYFTIEPLVEGHASYTHVIEIVRALEAQGWQVALIHPHHRPSVGSLPLRLWRIAGALVRFSVARKGDAVYMRMHPAAFPAAALCRLARLPYFVEINGPFQDVYIAWPQARRLRWLLDRLLIAQLIWAAGLFPVTPLLGAYARQLHRRLAHTKAVVVPNGANTGLFHPARANRTAIAGKALPSSYAILYGTLTHWQGIGTALHSTSEPEWPKSVALVLLGDGPLRSEIEQAAKRSSNIHYLGSLPYLSIAEIVASASIGLVLTENVDGRADTGVVPLKMVEMMASGVPMVVTDQPRQRDIVDEYGCGLIVAERAPKQVASAVAQLAGDKALAVRMGKNGREAALKEFDWRALGTKISDTILDWLRVHSDSSHRPSP